MENKIQEPIYVYTKDSNELLKYRFVSDAENSLEAYDLDNYEAYDSLYRKLKLYKKDKYNRVGFGIFNNESYSDTLFKYALNEAKYHTKDNEETLKNMSLDDLLRIIPYERV